MGWHQGAGNSFDWSILVYEFANINSIFLVPLLSSKLHQSHNLVRFVSGVSFFQFSPVTDTFIHEA